MSSKLTDPQMRQIIINKFTNAGSKNYRCMNKLSRVDMPSPSPEEINSPEFEAIWSVIKEWDINVGDGPSGGSGSHVKLILDKLKPTLRSIKLDEILNDK
jgi:hypothetical protein